MSSTVVVCDHCGRKNRVPAIAGGVPHCSNCHRPLPWIVDVGDAEFAEVADAATLPVLVDLWAPWCGPCRTVSPTLEQLARDFAGRVKLVKVNVDDAPTVAQRFGVQGIPTLLLLDHGRVVAQQVGAAGATELRTWLEGAASRASTDA